MSENYYNEIDPYNAAWLSNLIGAKLIADGHVDNRDIREVQPDDVSKYTQAHFFAGIGVWSYALRSAGWPDDRPVWTGSCPCQPFSIAGRQLGEEDPRHLWPDWFRLIRQCKPPVIFGEQVASQDGLAWFDTVRSDLEETGYAVGVADLCAAGVGAPHIRQRLYFVAHANGQRWHRRNFRYDQIQRDGLEPENEVTRSSSAGGLGNSNGPRLEGHSRRQSGIEVREGTTGRPWKESASTYWSNSEWIRCRDGKYRPTEPGLFPLANGSTKRMERLRAYGNAIVAPLAIEFIKSYMDVFGE